jgi:hypothetical protein
VDVAGAGARFSHQRAEPAGKLPIAWGAGQARQSGSGVRQRAGCHQAAAQLLGGAGGSLPVAGEVTADLVQPGADLCGGLELEPHQLLLRPRFAQQLEQLGGDQRRLAAGRVQQDELLLDPEGEQRPGSTAGNPGARPAGCACWRSAHGGRARHDGTRTRCGHAATSCTPTTACGGGRNQPKCQTTYLRKALGRPVFPGRGAAGALPARMDAVAAGSVVMRRNPRARAVPGTLATCARQRLGTPSGRGGCALDGASP